MFAGQKKKFSRIACPLLEASRHYSEQFARQSKPSGIIERTTLDKRSEER